MIYTVRGPIHKEEMGLTLCHEHFKWEYDDDFAQGMYFRKAYDDDRTKEVFDSLLPVVNAIRESGCQTVVEASPPIGGQNLKLLKELSHASDLHIVPSTGWNVFKHTYDIFSTQFADQLAQRWINDFVHGLDTIDGLLIRPGYIKILFDRGDIKAVDLEMLKAAIIASKETGMPIHCHVLEASMIYDVLDILERQEADMAKFLWAHADKEGDLNAITQAFKRGIWIGFDMIKSGTHPDRLQLIKAVIGGGMEDRLLLSQDYDFYEERDKAHVCASLFTDFLPFCINNGVDPAVMEKILKSNPANYYNID